MLYYVLIYSIWAIGRRAEKKFQKFWIDILHYDTFYLTGFFSNTKW
jgi:hypothetical protein